MHKSPPSPLQEEILLNAKQVSDKLGVSFQMVYRQKEKLGGINTRSGWVWPLSRIEAIVAERSERMGLGLTTLRSPLTGELSKIIFTACSKGKSAREIVMEYGLTPTVVREGIQEYAKLGACIFLTTEHLEAIYALPLTGIIPCTDANDLIFVLQQSIAPPEMCVRCKAVPAPKLCDACLRIVAKQRTKKSVLAL